MHHRAVAKLTNSLGNGIGFANLVKAGRALGIYKRI
jgi:hypothetical protein